MAGGDMIDTRFHALPTRNNKALPIDVGDCAIFDIQIDRLGNKHINTRKVPTAQETCTNPRGVSIPLTFPKFVHFSPEYHVKRTFRYPIQKSTAVRLTNQYKWYVKDKLDLHHIGLRDALGRKSAEWKSVRKIFRWHREHKFEFPDATSKTKRRKPYEPAQRRTTIYERFDDIPKSLLLSELEQSCYDDYIDYTENHSLRNCVAAYGSDHVIYVSGPYNNELVLGNVTTEEGTLLGCRECDRVETLERIMEIRCDHNLVTVRGRYSVTHFKIVDGENALKLKKTNQLTFDTSIYACATNPFTKDELVIANNQSVIVLSLDGNILHSIENTMVNLDDQPVDWQNIIYSNSVQQCLLSTKSEILLYDFREKPSTQRCFFDLPSEYFNRYELFSPVLCTSPLNNHHYVTSTNQSVVVMDERYLKAPVMKINHYMESPPRFAQTFTKRTDPERCFVAIGSYYDSEILGLNLRAGCEQEITMDDDVTFKSRSPLQMDGSLVKFSPSTDWSARLCDWRLGYKNIRNRIQQPLIGFCINDVTSSATNDGLVLIQGNLSCDLFYQRFTNQRKSSANATSDELISTYKDLDSNSESRCRSWLNECWDLCKEDSKSNDKSEHTYLDIGIIENGLSHNFVDSNAKEGEKILPKEESNGHHVRDSDLALKEESDYVPKEESDSESEMDIDMFETNNNNIKVPQAKNGSQNPCEESRLETKTDVESSLDKSVSVWEKLQVLRKGNQIMTRSALDLPPPPSPLTAVDGGVVADTPLLELVTDCEQYEKPLSRTLLKNWIEDEYTPLETFAPGLHFEDGGGEGGEEGGGVKTKNEEN